MICIEKIKISKFRGILDLEFDLDRKNFGICGANGTGKSGVVDAIEFGLTGNVSRLSGKGTGDLSVKKHAPHVDEQKNPEQATVTITIYVPELNKSATIHRNVKNPFDYELSPDDDDIRQVIEEVQLHPEFALSRREIIRYIITPPNDRAKDVLELLRLSEVEQVRKMLKKIANDAKTNTNISQQNMQAMRREFLQVLELKDPKSDAILKKINEQRKTLSLKPLTELSAKTSFKEGVPSEPEHKATGPKKVDVLADLKALEKIVAEGEDEETATKHNVALSTVDSLIKDASNIKILQQQVLVRAGLKLLDEDLCPLCDLEWDREELREHLNRKLESAKVADKYLDELKANINHLIGEFNAHVDLLVRIALVCKQLKPVLDASPIESHVQFLKGHIEDLSLFVSELSNFEVAKKALSLEWWSLPKESTKSIEACRTAITKLPDVTKKDQARDFLTLAEERFRRAVEARSNYEAANKKSVTASKILEIYERKSVSVLEKLYDEVADDFTAYYKFLNRDDECDFEGKLIPSAAKLGFNVDFYGRGLFPPGAYHSEGHQDGMGLCLYLALMKRTLADKFTFAVLDDVLMSIDVGHRREVCKLLKKEFPDTQFILTTHDRIWLKFMETEGLICNSQIFSGWSVETGPRVWTSGDVWEEIDQALSKDDVSQAASLLRRYLEYISDMMADSLRAKVQFKGDGQYDLGDLFPGIVSRWKKKLKQAIQVAQSWGKKDDVTKITALKNEVDATTSKIQAEQWAVNPSVHYNKWANFQKKEFQIVVGGFKEFLATLQCETCGSFVETVPRKGTAKEIRCSCGDLFINLEKKTS